MSDERSKSMIEQELRRLETRVTELIATLNQIKKENYALRQLNDHLNTERASLMQKSELTRSRVEGMIDRLKSLEHNA